MGVEKQLLSIPFQKGLSQKEADKWLAPGALLTAQNAIHNKTNVVSKRPGATLLSRTALTNVSGATLSILAGKRLGRFKGGLALIAQDSLTDGVYGYSEALAQPVFRDRVPEVYAFPQRPITGGSGAVFDCDTAYANGLLFHVWIVGLGPVTGTTPETAATQNCTVYYKVEDASTGQVIIAEQVIANAVKNGGVSAPKLVVCGTTVVLTVVSGYNDYVLYAGAISATNLGGGWSTFQSITALPNPWTWTGGSSFGCAIGVYDVCNVVGDTSSYVVVACPGTHGDTRLTHITLYQCSAANTLSGGSIVTTSTNIDGNDATWTADNGSPVSPVNKATITGFAVRADNNNNEVGVCYSWKAANSVPIGIGAGNTRVNFQTLKYTGTFGASLVTTVALMGTAGSPSPAPADNAAQSIAIERIGTIGGAQSSYKVYFSPIESLWNVVGGAGGCTAYIANYLVGSNSGTGIVLNNQPRITYGVRLASRIVAQNSIGYVVGYLPSQNQGTYFIFADDAWVDVFSSTTTGGQVFPFPFRLVATLAPRLSSGMIEAFNVILTAGAAIPTLQPFVLPHLVANPKMQGANVAYHTLLPITAGQITVCEPALFAWDFASPLAYQTAELGENMGIASGCPSLHDGSGVFEFGFPCAPVITALAGATGGGSLVAGQTYQYIAVYEQRDRRGQRHRSPRSTPVSITLGAGKTSVQVTVAQCGFSARQKASTYPNTSGFPATGHGPAGYADPAYPITIRLYRTIAGGTTYYDVDPTDSILGTGSDNRNAGQTAAAFNLLNVPTNSLFDGNSDTLIQLNEQVYDDGSDGTQQGSILDNRCPPAFQALIVHQNRFYGIDGPNVWASKAFTTGEGSGFHELMAFSVDDGPNVCTALASLDDKLIIFKRDRVLYMTGLGPNDAGGANDWTPPARIAADVGCIDWRSVVVTPEGVFFWSDEGLRLLSRDLQVSPVPHVEDLLNANIAVTSAVIHPNRSRVLWTANVDDVTVPRTGIGIDHDYVLDTWFSSQSLDGTGTVQGAVGAAVISVPIAGQLEPVYHWLRTDGTVYRESWTSFLDGAVYQPTTLETAWVKSGGIANFARFRRLLVTWENLDPHQLQVFVAYDYSPSATAPTYYLLGTVSALKMSAMQTPLAQALFSLPRQRAQAVRFKIVDAADPALAPVTGAGPLLVSLDLEVSVYTNKRTARLPAAQRY